MVLQFSFQIFLRSFRVVKNKNCFHKIPCSGVDLNRFLSTFIDFTIDSQLNVILDFVADLVCSGEGNRFAVEERDLCNHIIFALIFQPRFTCLSVRKFFIVDEPFISGHIFQIFRALQLPAVFARSAAADAAADLFNFDFAGVLRKETFLDVSERSFDFVSNIALLIGLQEDTE